MFIVRNEVMRGTERVGYLKEGSFSSFFFGRRNYAPLILQAFGTTVLYYQRKGIDGFIFFCVRTDVVRKREA